MDEDLIIIEDNDLLIILDGKDKLLAILRARPTKDTAFTSTGESIIDISIELEEIKRAPKRSKRAILQPAIVPTPDGPITFEEFARRVCGKDCVWL